MKNKKSSEKSEENYEENNEEIKVILVGDSGVGKTSLIQCALGNNFMEGTQISTMVCTNVKIEMKINDKKYKINLWDTIGQERFRSLTTIFLKDSQIVIFVCDLTSKESFKGLDYWFDLIQEELGSNIIMGIIVNKRDLTDEQIVEDDLIEQYANKKGLDWTFCSALEPNLFNKFLQELIIKYSKSGFKNNKDNESDKKSYKLKSTKNKKKKSKCC